VSIAEGLLALGRIGHHEAGIGVRQVEREEVDLALHPADDADRLAEIDLRVTRRMRQRHEHLPCPLPPADNVVLHDRDATREAMLVPETLEDALWPYAAALRPDFVFAQDTVDGGDERTQLRLHRRLRAPVARRHREPHHLGHRSRIHPEPAPRRSLKPSI
jgi:hypothetical protein